MVNIRWPLAIVSHSRILRAINLLGDQQNIPDGLRSKLPPLCVINSVDKYTHQA